MGCPGVDIVLPTYRPRFFEQALRSALGQTYPNIQIYVSDNCPDDAIKQICQRHASPNLHYKRSSDLRILNYEAAFRSGGNPVVKPLFDDDILHPFCVERMMAKAGKHLMEGKVGFVFSSSELIDTRNRRYFLRRPLNTDRVIRTLDFMNLTIGKFENVVGEFSTVAFPRARVSECANGQLFRWNQVDGYSALPDIVFFLRVIQNFPAIYVDEVLSYFRLAPDHDSDSNQTLKKNILIHTHWFGLMEEAFRCKLPEFAPDSKKILGFVESIRRTFGDDPAVALKCDSFSRNFYAQLLECSRERP
jgi:glycosyltransferase involved in cell wall biosynthesis